MSGSMRTSSSTVPSRSTRLSSTAATTFGIRHLPVSAEDFATWRPGVVGHEEVRADELEGYEIWRAAYEARMKLRLARP